MINFFQLNNNANRRKKRKRLPSNQKNLNQKNMSYKTTLQKLKIKRKIKELLTLLPVAEELHGEEGEDNFKVNNKHQPNKKSKLSKLNQRFIATQDITFLMKVMRDGLRCPKRNMNQLKNQLNYPQEPNQVILRKKLKRYMSERKTIYAIIMTGNIEPGLKSTKMLEDQKEDT